MTDSVCIDLLRINAEAVSRVQREAAQLALLPGWRSAPEAYLRSGGLGWHWNHTPPDPGGKGGPRPSLPPAPGESAPRPTVTHHLHAEPYAGWLILFRLIRESLGIPGAQLVRAYLNAYPYGCDTGAHRDSRRPDELTCILPVHESWHHEYGGETAILDERGEIARAVLPAPGRAFVFRSSALHAARPLTRSCPLVRRVIVFKFGVYPPDRPLCASGPDALALPPDGTPFGAPLPKPGSLSPAERLAALASWIGRGPLQGAPSPWGAGTAASYAQSAALHVLAAGFTPDDALAALARALAFSPDPWSPMLDLVRLRPKLIALVGEAPLQAAFDHASLLPSEIERLRDLATSEPDDAALAEFAPRAPRPPAGHRLALPLTRERMRRILAVDLASSALSTPDPARTLRTALDRLAHTG